MLQRGNMEIGRNRKDNKLNYLQSCGARERVSLKLDEQHSSPWWPGELCYRRYWRLALVQEETG